MGFTDGTALSGNFGVQAASGQAGTFVLASNVTARLGDPGRGAALQLNNGTLAMLLDGDGYAVSASGGATLQGMVGASLTGQLGFSANTLGRAVNATFTVGSASGTVNFPTGDAVQGFSALGASLLLPGLASLSGDFAFTARSSVVGGAQVADLLVGGRNLTASLAFGDLALAATNATAALAITTRTPGAGGAGQSSIALLGTADLSATVDSAVSFTGTRVAIRLNSGSAAVAALVPTTGDALALALPANTAELVGQLSLSIVGVATASGQFRLALDTATLTLSDGRTATVRELTITGRNALFGATAGAVSATLSGADVALVYARESIGVRSWVTAKVVPAGLTLGDFSFGAIGSAALSLNKAVLGSDAVVLAWTAPRSIALEGAAPLLFDQLVDSYTLPVQGELSLGGATLFGALNLTLSQGPSGWSWLVDVAGAQLTLAAGAAFVRLGNATGQLRLNSDRTRSGNLAGSFAIGGPAGLRLSGDATASFGAGGAFTLAGTASLALGSFATVAGGVTVQRVVGTNGPQVLIGASGVNGQFGDTGNGVALSNATLGLVLAPDALGRAGYALLASGDAALAGFGGCFTLAGAAQVQVNTLGRAVDAGITVGAGLVHVLFADDAAVQAVQLLNTTLKVGDAGTLTGNFLVASSMDAKGTTLSIGADSVAGSLALGGATAALTAGVGAVLLRHGADGSNGYAVQLDGSVALSGVTGLTVTATQMRVGLNRMAGGLETTVATAAGSYAVSLLAGQTRVSGTAQLDVAGLVSLSGGVFIESTQNQAVTVAGDSGTTQVDQLTMGGTGLLVSLTTGNDALGAELENASLALVLATEQGGAGRRWLSGSGTALAASFAGYGLDKGSTIKLSLNRALANLAGADTLAAPTTPAIDWSKASRTVVLSQSASVVLNMASGGFTIPVSGSMALAGASVRGSFEVRLNQDSLGGRTLELAASEVSLGFTAGGAKVSIEHAAGALVLGPNGQRSGSISGAGSVTGVAGLDFNGALAAGFDTSGALSLAGNVALNIADYGQFSGSFAVAKTPAVTAVPVESLNLATPGADGQVAAITAGGVQTNTVVLLLQVSDASGQLAREGVHGFTFGGQTATASSRDGHGVPLSDAVFAANIQLALESLRGIGTGNVQVAGSRAAGFSITFVGALAGQSVALGAAGLGYTQPPEAPGQSEWGVITQVRGPTAAANEQQALVIPAGAGSFTLSLGSVTTDAITVLQRSTAVNERQVVTLVGDPNLAGQFQLSLGGQTMAKIRFGTGPVAIAAAMQAALEKLVGTGNVRVSYETAFAGNNTIRYDVDFRGALAGMDVALLSGSTTLSGLTISVATTRQGSAGFSVQDQAARIQTALEARLGAGNVSVGYDAAGNQYLVDFLAALGGQNQPQLVAFGGVVTSSSLRQGSAASGAVQTVDLYDNQRQGRFTLSLAFNGNSYTTADIAFDASAAAVRLALLGAANPAGATLAAQGVDPVVALLPAAGGTHVWQVIFGGTAAAADLPLMNGLITSLVTPPEASLRLVATGTTTSEVQRLTLTGGGAFRLSLGDATTQTATLGAAASAADLAAALAALPGIGAGNVVVSQVGAGVFDLSFIGALAGKALAGVVASPVQTLSLLLADGRAPDTVALRLGSGGTWTVPMDVTNRSQAQIATNLASLIGMLPGIGFGQGNVEVTARAGTPWSFDVAFVNALVGADPGQLAVAASHTDVVQQARILIGAAGVSGTLGGGGAGLNLAAGSLALVMQANAAGVLGYALQAAGMATLTGFDGQVSLTATARLAINTLGEAVAVRVPTGVATPAVNLAFADGTDRREVTIARGDITVSGLGTLSGALKLVSTSTLVNGNRVDELDIGLDAVGGALTLGGLGATLTDGRGALLLRTQTGSDGVVTRGYAVQADGSISVTGAEAVTLSAADLRIGYNRSGSALNAQVATATGSYAVSLVSGETRLSGAVHAEIAGILALDGQLSIEGRSNQVAMLADGTQVQTDQLVIAGANVGGRLVAGGSGLDVTLGEMNIALVLSTEAQAGSAKRRWITSVAQLGSASIAGYALENLQSADLQINRALDAATGALAEVSAAVLSFAGNAAQTVALNATTSLTLAMAGATFAIPVSGSLQLGPARLAGDFNVALAGGAGSRSWTITASDARLALEAGPASVGITSAAGTLVLGANGARSGSLSGAAAISGLGDLSLGGTFTASFGPDGSIGFSGSGVALSVGSFGTLTGDLSASHGADGSILLGAAHVGASFGDPSAGLGVSDASLGLHVAAATESSAGYALVATGTANLHGFGAVTLAAQATVRVNTLGHAVDQAAMGVAIKFADATAVQEVSIASGSLTVGRIGTLVGALAVKAVSDGAVTTMQIGVDAATGTLTLGGLSASLAGGRGAVLLRKDATGSGYALQAEGAVTLAGGDAVSLSLTNFQIAYNGLGQAVTPTQVQTGLGSYTVALLAGEQRMRGHADVVVSNVLTLSGDVFLQNDTNQAVALAGGGNAQVDQLLIGGTGLTASIGSGDASAVLAGVDLALVLSSERPGGSGRKWLTGTGSFDGGSIAGHALDRLGGSAISLNRVINAAGMVDSTEVVNWSGAAKAVTLAPGQVVNLSQAVQGFSIAIDGALQVGAARLAGALTLAQVPASGGIGWQVTASDVAVSVASGGTRLGLEHGSGTLNFGPNHARSGSISGAAFLRGIAALSLNGSLATNFDSSGGMGFGGTASLAVVGIGTLGGSFSVLGEPGANGRILVGANGLTATLGDSGAGVALARGSLGLLLGKDSAGLDGYALYASGDASLHGFGTDVTLSASAAVRVNTLGQAVSQQIATGSTPVTLSFADGTRLSEVAVDSGTLAVVGIGPVTGRLKLSSTTATEGTTQVSELRIGLDGIAGSLTLGGVAAALSAGDGAVVLRREAATGGVVTTRYALVAEGAVGLTGVDGVTLNAPHLQIAVNRWGAAYATTVQGIGRSFALDLVDNETRLQGQMHVAVAGAVSLDGNIFLESRTSQTVALAGGGSVVVNQLVFGGAGVAASLGDSSVGASLSDVSIVLVLSSEAGGTRRWLTGEGSIGGATIAGYALNNPNAAKLVLNRTLGAGSDVFGGSGPALNFAAAPVVLDLGGGITSRLDARDVAFELNVDGAMQFGPAALSGSFTVALQQAAGGARSWNVTAGDASVSLSAGGARVGIDQITGALTLGANGQRAGQFTGAGSVSGVDGLSLTRGSFTTSFDSSGNLQLAGAVDLTVAGTATLSGQFGVTRSVPASVAPAVVTRSDGSAGSGSLGVITAGGVATNTVLQLNASSADGTRFRKGSYGFSINGASAAVSTLDANGVAVSDAALAARLQSGLQLLFGTANVLVIGSRASGFGISFTGALAGHAVTGLSMTPQDDIGTGDSWSQSGVVQQAAAGVGATHLLTTYPPGAVGSFTLVFDYEARTNTRLQLTAAGAGGSFREGIYGFTRGGTTTNASSLAAAGAMLGDAAFAANITTALVALYGAGNVQVSGSRAAGFTIEFVGTLAGTDVVVGNNGLTFTPPADPSAGLAGSGGTSVERQASATALASSYDLLIQRPEGASHNLNNFSFSFAGGTRGVQVKFVDIQVTQPRQIRDALEQLVGSGNVTVTALSSPMAAQQYRISFANGVLTQGALQVRNTGLPEVTYTLSPRVAAGTPSATGAVQLVQQFPAVAQGSFTLAMQVGGSTYTTGAIGLHASDATMQATLLAAQAVGGSTLGGSGVTLTVATDGALNAWRISFGGAGMGQVTPAMTRAVTPLLAPAAQLSLVASGSSLGAGSYTTAPIDLHATPTAVQGAILAATGPGGSSFASTGASLAVTLDSGAGTWRLSFGAAAVGQAIPAMQVSTSITAAPGATLATVSVGARSSAVQHLALVPGAGSFALAFLGRVSAPLQAEGLTAAAVQAALEPLAGAGNPRVTNAAGGWDIAFQGALAGQAVPLVRLAELRSLDLVLADGSQADIVRVKATGAAYWAASATLGGLTDTQQRQALTRAFEAVYGRGNVTVLAAQGQPGHYLLLGAGSMAGTNLAANTLGLSRAVAQPPGYLLIGAADAGVTFGSASAGLALTHASLGLVLTEGAAATGYALLATGTASLAGFSGAVALNATGALRINTLGQAVNQTVRTGLTTPDQVVSFATGDALNDVSITQGTVQIANLGSLTGGLRVISSTSVAAGIRTTDITIGLQGMSAALTLGGVGAILGHGQGGIVLRLQQAADGSGAVTSQYAVAADGDVALTGVSGLTLTAEKLQLAWNRWGSALDTSVATGTGSYVVHLADQESRLRGTMHVAVGGVLDVAGELFLESHTGQSAKLAGGGTVAVDELVIGGAGLSATLGDAAVGAKLDLAALGLVLISETGGSGRRWLSALGDLSGLTVQGYSVDSILGSRLEINRALGTVGDALANNGAALDWSDAPLAIAVGNAAPLVIGFSAAALHVALDGSLAFGPVSLGGSLDIALNQVGAVRNWTISVSNGRAVVAAEGAQVALSNGTGTLTLGANGQRQWHCLADRG